MNSLLMTAENGQKTYAGSKTQTRRTSGLEAVNTAPDEWRLVENWFPDESIFVFGRGDDRIMIESPFRVGERRYIREPHYLYGRWTRDGQTKTGKPKYRFVADRTKGACYPTNPPPRVCTRKSATGWFRRPGMFMFEWAARSVVEITGLRTERVQDIRVSGAILEGAPPGCDPIGWFAQIWDSPAIHGPGAWERNDWVVVVTFRRVRA